jgi:hypothetical protein
MSSRQNETVNSYTQVKAMPGDRQNDVKVVPRIEPGIQRMKN